MLQLTRLTTRSGAYFDIVYDGLDREVLKDPSASGEPSIATVYDLSGRVMSVSQVGGTEFTYTYDILGRPLTKTRNGLTIAYAWDNAGNQTSFTWMDGSVTTYAYDVLDRMVSISDRNGTTGSAQVVATYAYDVQSRLTAVRYGADAGGTGAAGSGAGGNVSTVAFTYDQFGAVVSQDIRFASGLPGGLDYDYTWDRAGRLDRERVGDSDFVWLPPANDTITTPANNLNQASAIGTSFLPSRPIQYDLNGNLTSFGVGVLDGQSGVFTYDSENRMTSATVWAPMLGMDGQATMGYDPAGLSHKFCDLPDPPADRPRIGCMTRKSALLASLSLLLAGCSVFGDQGGIEQPPYRVVSTLAENITIREYGPRIAVEATVTGKAMDGSEGDAFGLLFDYISGANVAKAEIAMTAPVETSGASQSIEMTAPVESRYGDDGMTMRFFLPSSFTRETAPRPTDPRVQLVFLPPETYAVLTYAGSRGRDTVLEKERELRAALSAAGIEAGPDVRAYFYDPPWTLPWFRTNEVAIRLDAAS
ncbi:MAG TPA: heme-binding protein [Accumulibacter sp.]|uniref:heme-binding protein n=1 Tax=Accumulibacter sp. TaxID=2053492 RepID=UPI002B79DB5F|nr:heme-binding protein [Accumulibacter sp.]HRD87328.1 heme-binding protein [Accumulibacter sp.]